MIGGGGGGRLLVPEILSQSDHVGAKFEQWAAITPKWYEIGVRLVGSEMCIRDRFWTDNRS